MPREKHFRRAQAPDARIRTPGILPGVHHVDARMCMAAPFGATKRHHSRQQQHGVLQVDWGGGTLVAAEGAAWHIRASTWWTPAGCHGADSGIRRLSAPKGASHAAWGDAGSTRVSSNEPVSTQIAQFIRIRKGCRRSITKVTILAITELNEGCRGGHALSHCRSVEASIPRWQPCHRPARPSESGN